MHAVQRLPLERRRCLRSVQQATVNRGERDARRVNPAAASVEGGGAVCAGPPCAAGLRRTAWDGALRERRDVGRVVQGQRDDRWEVVGEYDLQSFGQDLHTGRTQPRGTEPDVFQWTTV
jgi:hypothetical protein